MSTAMTRTVRKRSLSVGLAIAIVVVACFERASDEPLRPPNVPFDAVWAGGSDGGCFVQCKADRDRNVNVCVAYLSTTGEILQRGDYQIRGSGRAATHRELTYEWCDGQVIGLKSGQVLEPVITKRQQGTKDQ